MEIAPDPMRDYFLHSDSSGDFLNDTSPIATDAKYKDSASVNRTTYKEIGTWSLTVQQDIREAEKHDTKRSCHRYLR